MAKRFDFGQCLIILGALIIILWVILKSFGIINSPVWVEMVPYVGGVASMVGVAYQFGRVMHRIESIEEKLDRMIQMEQRFLKVEHEHNLAMTGQMKFKHAV